MTIPCSALPGDATGAGEADGGNSLLGSISIGVVGEHGGDGAELQESITVSMKHEGKENDVAVRSQRKIAQRRAAAYVSE